MSSAGGRVAPSAADGPWGPTVMGGRNRRLIRRIAWIVAGVAGTALVLSSVVGFVLLRIVESNVDRVPVGSLVISEDGKPLNVLVVGSDSREGLTREERIKYTVGLEDTGGQRSDTVILVSVLPDLSGVNLVSFPRDLPVVYDDRRFKLTETFFGGPDAVVSTIHDNFGVPVHHYVEVSITGFVGVVEAVGSVNICLDEPLIDRKSGADFPEPGCYDMNPRQALAYSRSRQGARGDFERIERQQTFMRALLDEIVDTRLLFDVPKLLSVVEEVASNVTTDEELSVGDMRELATELRGLADGTIPMVTVPGYVRSISGKSFVVPYGPGARALFDTVEAGELLAPRGSPDQRAETTVAVWSAGRDGAAIVRDTLSWSGFRSVGAGQGPVDGGPVTTVYVVPGNEQQAGWVAATLGAPMQPLPEGVTPPDGASVVVAVGDDATS